MSSPSTYLKVVHTSPFPGDSFEYPVSDLIQAWVVLNTLAAYDEFQIARGIRSNFSSTQILLVWDVEEEEWVEYNANNYYDVGVEDITDLTLNEVKELVYTSIQN